MSNLTAINNKTKMFVEGRAYWQEYVNVNGYAFRPTPEGIKKLARILDLESKYFLPQILAFLEA